MDVKEQLSNKIYVKRHPITKNSNLRNPIKRLYFLEGKHFIIIDKSITDKLNFSDTENNELYFQQEVTEDHCIILRPFKLSE